MVVRRSPGPIKHAVFRLQQSCKGANLTQSGENDIGSLLGSTPAFIPLAVVVAVAIGNDRL